VFCGPFSPHCTPSMAKITPTDYTTANRTKTNWIRLDSLILYLCPKCRNLRLWIPTLAFQSSCTKSVSWYLCTRAPTQIGNTPSIFCSYRLVQNIITLQFKISQDSFADGLNFTVRRTSVPTVYTVSEKNTVWLTTSNTARNTNRKSFPTLTRKGRKTRPFPTRTSDTNFQYSMSFMSTLKVFFDLLKTTKTSLVTTCRRVFAA